MLRRVSRPVTAPVMASMTATRQYGAVGGFLSNPVRRPQLSDKEREQVVIDQSKWPEMFKDYNPDDPYRKAPNWIPGMSTWHYVMWGIQFSFICTFMENVFPSINAL